MDLNASVNPVSWAIRLIALSTTAPATLASTVALAPAAKMVSTALARLNGEVKINRD